MTDILIRLPWPPAKLSANGSQRDYLGKARVAKSYKRLCGLECIAQGIRRASFSEAHVEVTFCPPSARSYDLDNALKKAKQGLDAVAEATGIDDAQWRSMSLVRGAKVKGGCVLVHVKPLLVNVPVRRVIS